MKKKLPPETPVYLFLGFLESGKTKFIQETLEDERFDTGERTLLLVTEEGEEEYDPSRFAVKNVTVVTLDKKEEFNEENLTRLQESCKAKRVLVEYNGMWLLDEFYKAMPEGWMINQVMTFIDSKTFLSYNANMRQLMFDKIQNTQMVVFNRLPEEQDKMEFHKLVRAITRRADIVYEHIDGKAEYDDIEDPLPFDVKAPVIDIEDRDYAFFYRDLSENMEDYIGKTVKFKGMVATDKRLPPDNIVIGRHIMTCCEADIQYSGLACILPQAMELKTRDWLEITAKIEMQEHTIYRGKGPVLLAKKAERCTPPEEQLATFY
ncbi:MAG: GTP-binding protein [Christensenellaceae bacterium]|jgi:G3E family GTPase-like protein